MHMNGTTVGTLLLAGALAGQLAGCTSGGAAGVTDAATAPLSDLNLVKAPIPATLLAAQKQPYAMPADANCAALAREVGALDEVLGADLDAPATPSNPGLIERGSSAAGTAAVGALRGAAEGLVPYRGWVRKLSGAERYSNEVAAAIAAGTVRRAFLKGIAAARACAAAPVAAPAPASSTPPTPPATPATPAIAAASAAPTPSR
jgi:hypothetical protein